MVRGLLSGHICLAYNEFESGHQKILRWTKKSQVVNGTGDYKMTCDYTMISDGYLNMLVNTSQQKRKRERM
jgi:hypothetical protein